MKIQNTILSADASCRAALRKLGIRRGGFLRFRALPGRRLNA
jgi:hypothetical protein